MTVNINVLNPIFRRIAVIDEYTSLIWCKRYNDVGALDLQIEATKETLEIFRKGNYITRDDDDAVFRIEALELDTSADDGDSLIVGAYDCKKILSQRIIWHQINFSGTVENYMRRIIQENLINPPLGMRRISNFALKDARGFGETIIAQSQFDNVGEKIIELCKANRYGWRVTLEDRKFYFDIYKGVDRSADQKEVPRVVFSPDYDNLLSSKYHVDESEYKNAALVGGEGEGAARKTRAVGDAAGLDRREMFVDSNVSSESGGDLVDYYEALIANGKEELAKNATVTTFEGDIDPQSYKYKKDYNLGDIVTIENEYGIKVNARIVEIAETWDNTGYGILPKFDYTDSDVQGGILTEDGEHIFTEDGEALLEE